MSRLHYPFALPSKAKRKAAIADPDYACHQCTHVLLRIGLHNSEKAVPATLLPTHFAVDSVERELAGLLVACCLLICKLKP